MSQDILGYNKANYKAIREEYETKYLLARQRAERRRAEIHALYPEVAEIDRALACTGLSIMEATMQGGDVEQKIAEVRRQNEELLAARAMILTEAGFPADYTELKYECEVCGDTGFVDFKMCDCMKRRIIEAGYESSGMANLLADPKEYAYMSRVLTIIKDYADTFESGKSGNLFLYGNTGLGKTHLSSAIAKTVIDRGYDVFYVTALSMISDFEHSRFGAETGSETGSDTSRYFECDLLIIDDLGSEVINKFTTSTLYNIINGRMNRKLSTIINTNFTQDEFRKQYWDRITSRVFGEYRCLPFMGSDIRRQKCEER